VGLKQWMDANAQRKAERRRNALAKMARDEKLGAAERGLVRKELKAKQRAEALALLAAGKKVPFTMQSLVRAELEDAQALKAVEAGKAVTAATRLPGTRSKRIALLKTAAPGTDRIENLLWENVGKRVDEYAEAGWSVMSQSSYSEAPTLYSWVTVWFRKS